MESLTRQVAVAAQNAGRPSGSVQLVAVSKNVAEARIVEALASGVRDFGENRVQELVAKRADPRLASCQWHFIGHLQSNKVSKVVGACALVHSVDSWKLAEALSDEAKGRGLVQPILVQVNTSGETSKFGLTPAMTPELVGRIVRELPGVEMRGLMTIGPTHAGAEQTRACFRELRQLRDALATQLRDDQPHAHETYAVPTLQHLSMGMSQDFPVAIEEGATLIRIGSSLFGPRAAPPTPDPT